MVVKSIYSFSISRRPRRATLFPYTTLFRSYRQRPKNAGSPEPNLCGWSWRRLSEKTSFRGFSMTLTTRTSLRSEEHTSELQSRFDLVCRLLLEKKKYIYIIADSKYQFYDNR